jgi:hypothetical protein
MSNLVKYQPYTEEDATHEAEDLDRTAANFLKLSEGRSVVRILPALPGKGYGPNKNSPFRTVFTHFLRKPGEKDALTSACPNKEANQHCVACEIANKLKTSGNKADANLAYDFFAKRRVYVSVIDREDPEKGVQVLGVGKTVHEALVKIRKDVDAGGDFTDPVNGFDIIIERKGTGKTDTEYTVMPARKQSPLGNMDWIDEQPDLNVFAKVKKEEIEKFFSKGDDDAPPRETKTVNERPKQQARARNAADDIEGDVPV